MTDGIDSDQELALSDWGRLAFSAACLERVIPVYRGYCTREGEDDFFGELLDRIWEHLGGAEAPEKGELEELDALGLELLPSGGGPGVQDVALAVLLGMAELRGKRLAVAGCARLALDLVVGYEMNENGLSLRDARTSKMAEEEAARQKRDWKEIVELQVADETGRGPGIDKIRARSELEAPIELVRSGE